MACLFFSCEVYDTGEEADLVNNMEEATRRAREGDKRYTHTQTHTHTNIKAYTCTLNVGFAKPSAFKRHVFVDYKRNGNFHLHFPVSPVNGLAN